MEATVLLCDSTICRLCGEPNDNGTVLFPVEADKENLSELINRYLPLKVLKDDKFPCTLCPGCTIQLEATRSFFDLIIEGQAKLRELFALQQDTLKRQEKQKEQLENALKIVNPNSSVQTYSLQADDTGEKIFIQILSDGPLFPPDHETALKAEGLDKPRKKRGRPPKPPQSLEPEPEPIEKPKEADEPIEYDEDGKRRRRIKKPSRYSEVLQGKELDRVLKEEGVFDDDEFISDMEHRPSRKNVEGINKIVGHVEAENGENLGDLVALSTNNRLSKIRHKTDTIKRKEKYKCEICGREFMHIGRLEVHKSFHKNVNYQCSTSGCSAKYETATALGEHQKETSHSGCLMIESLENYGQVEQSQSSDFSNAEPSTKSVETEELKKEISDNPITVTSSILCALCNKVFSCLDYLREHRRSVHDAIDSLHCSKCDKTFNNATTLKQHEQQHAEKIHACDSCGKTFNHPSSLVYHREAEHSNGRRFVCNKCKKTFKHKQLLLRHQLVHTDERPHGCHCGATFKTKANLLNHMPTHTGEKKFYCAQCGQSFAHKTSLKLHLNWHSGQKPFECDVCKKRFSQKGNLAEHKRIHTGEKPYACTYCDQKFTTSSQFKLHLKRHTGERPWSCEYCSKTFLHKDTWKSHTRRHRNEKPYQCSQCLRRFTEHWALRKHERLHTGVRPFTCSVCSKTFTDSSNLKKHKRIHLNNKTPTKIVKTENLADIMSLAKEATEDIPKEQNSSQILYLSYQDPNTNEEQRQTLVHIVDTAVENQTDELLNGAFLKDNSILNENNEEELDIQLQQLVDNDGNPINLAMADGQQIKVVSTILDNEQCIQGLMPDGTLVPINLTMEDGKPVAAEVVTDDVLDKLKEPALEENPQEILHEQLLLPNTMAHIEPEKLQFFNTDKLVDTEVQDKIQFLTEDGKNVCFISSDNIDLTALGVQYINMG